MASTGLRISDAVNLTLDSVKKDGKVRLRMVKTKVAVCVPLPSHVAAALEATPRVKAIKGAKPRYFWSGNGQLQSAVKDYEEKIRKVVVDFANVRKGDTFMVNHRFRDTFAVAFLAAGNSIDDLSTLLGHKSIRITEKHYAPWVKARQERLESKISSMWEEQTPFVQCLVQSPASSRIQ